MKMKFKLILIVFFALITVSCGNNANNERNNESDNTEKSTETVSQEIEENKSEIEDSTSTNQFNLEAIPTTDKDLGTFPYLSAPKKTEYINGGGELLEFDQTFVPLNGVLTPVEGPSFRAYIHAEGGEKWGQFYVEKSYEDMILSLGGVKVSDEPVSLEEVERIGTDKLRAGGDGSFDFWNSDPIKTYVIKKSDGTVVYIQLQANSASGSIQIAQSGAFEQTIQLIQAEEIKNQLDENGKAILYINFDTDKATLKSDGEKVVAEISKVLNQDENLRLSIEGHTDNTGSAERNLALSKERAATVVDKLVEAGIGKDRLKASGFGSEKPMVDNNSEENMAKNRRVELVKI